MIPEIKNRRRYFRKQKATDASKDDDLDLLGDEDMESFSGSHGDLEGAADNLFASPPHPQPLHFEALSLKTPAKTVPPTPGTALQQKIESKLEKSVGSQFNIQLQQQMGAFQASMLEAMKSLRDEMQSIKKSAKEVELDQSSTSASKPGPSKQSDKLHPNTAPNLPNTQSECTDEAKELNLCGPSLPPQFGDAQSKHGSDLNHCSDHHSDFPEQPEQVCSSRAKKHSDKRKHNVWAKYISQSSSSEEDQSSANKKRSSQPPRAPSELDQPQHDPDPLFYTEVAMADLTSQYAEEVETFRHILNLPEPRETMPKSFTSVLGLDDQKGQQELRARGPLPMLPLRSRIKDINLNKTSWHLIDLRESTLNPLPPLQSGTRWDSLVLKVR